MVIIGMDFQKFKYCEDTDSDDVNGINQTTQHVYKFEACLQFSPDILRHHYLLTTESMRRMPKALLNNRSNIIVGSCKQTMLLYFQRQNTNANFTDPCPYVQYIPRGFPTFRKTPRKIFRAEKLPVFLKSVFLGVFLMFPPRTFNRPSEGKLRELRRFSSAKLGGNKMGAIDDFSIKLHSAWQLLCSSVQHCKIYILYIYMHTNVHVIFFLSVLGSHEIVTRYSVIMLSMKPCLLSTTNSMYTYM